MAEAKNDKSVVEQAGTGLTGTSAFYGQRGRSLLAEAILKKQTESEKIVSSEVTTIVEKHSQTIPASNRVVEFEMRYIESKDINDLCVKSRYNRRSSQHLTKTSVLDLFDDIDLEKMNSVPAYGYERPDGTIEILAGMRRTFTVSLIPDAKLMILIASDLSPLEQMSLAYTSDEYKKPSNVDMAYSIYNYVYESNSKLSESDKLRINDSLFEELQNVFKKSRGYISEHFSFAQFPPELFELFPDVSFVNYKFLRSLLNFKANDKLVEALKSIECVEVLDSDDVEAIKLKTAEKQKAILSTLTVRAVSSIPQNLLSFSNSKAIEGASVKATKQGLTINVNKKLLEDPTFEQRLKSLLINED